MANLSKSVAIVGVAESDEIGRVDKSSLQLHAEAAYNALEDAGLSIRDVDGLLSAGFSTMTIAEYLGIEPGYTDGTAVGGSSFVIHIAHAIAAINAGYCEVALVTHGQAGRSGRDRMAVISSEPRPPVRDSIWLHGGSHPLLNGVPPVHARVRRRPGPRGDG